jgi:2-dehydro-3-deoxyphosphogalactonate aldolase
MVEWPRLRCPVVAILRGIKPDEIEPIAGALIDEGIEAIEVPLNSPEPLVSIRRLAGRHGERVLVGGGTMLSIDDVNGVHAAGGRLMVSPNTDAAVIRRGVELGMVTMPGVFTPTDAFLALAASASALKFFPAGNLGPGGIAAIKAVLPANVVIGAVGGIGPENMAEFAKVGVSAFGLGTALYLPGDDADAVAGKARAIMLALKAASLP